LRVQGSGFRVKGQGLRVEGLWLRVWELPEHQHAALRGGSFI